jgi:protocatechuate 3,4-dioxygenase beta subunit
VTVLVLDEATGAPVADATVRLAEEGPKVEHGRSRVAFTIDDDSGEPAPFGPGTAQSARTGADGKASVTSLPGKTARISVRHAGYALYQSEPVVLPLQENLEQTVRLSLGGSVTVEVVDSHGAPVSGADVDHQGPGAVSVEMTLSSADSRTDAEGKLVFDHLQTGAHRFRLRQGSGGGVFSVGGGRAVVRHVSRSGGDDEPGWSSVDVDGHTAATVRLVAPEHGTLAGRVTEAGQPLANATLQLTAKGEEDTPSFFRSGGRNTHTDGRGEYLFDGVDEGEYTLSVEHATRQMTFDAPTRVRAGENRLDLDLPVAIVEGTVTGEDGKPVAGARIHAEKAPSATGGRRTMGMSVMVVADGGDEPEVSVNSSADAGPTVTTDATGHYSLRGVLADVELVVEAEAKDVQPARSAAFKAKPDDVKKNVDLRLERGGTIQVSVQRAGKAAGGFLARASLLGSDRDAGSPPKIQMVGPSGNTKLTGLKPGKWSVTLDAIGGALPGGSDEAHPEKVVDVQVGETAQASFQVP